MQDNKIKTKKDTEGHQTHQLSRLFPAQKTSLFTLLYRFIFHVHKQKYIHSSHFGTVFFSFFCTQKITKSSKKHH